MFINQATECQAPSYRDRRLARMAFFNVFSFFKRIFVTKKKEKFTRFLLLMLLWLLGCFLSCLKSLKWSSTTFCTTSHQITSHITKSHCFLARFFSSFVSFYFLLLDYFLFKVRIKVILIMNKQRASVSITQNVNGKIDFGCCFFGRVVGHQVKISLIKS